MSNVAPRYMIPSNPDSITASRPGRQLAADRVIRTLFEFNLTLLKLLSRHFCNVWPSIVVKKIKILSSWSFPLPDFTQLLQLDSVDVRSHCGAGSKEARGRAFLGCPTNSTALPSSDRGRALTALEVVVVEGVTGPTGHGCRRRPRLISRVAWLHSPRTFLTGSRECETERRSVSKTGPSHGDRRPLKSRPPLSYSRIF